MRDYAKVSALFWSGSTGRSLRGNVEAQILAFYLMTCHSSNMLGLYYLPIPTILHETGRPLQGATKGLRSLSEALFCHYNPETEYVWVVEMARWQVGEQLDAKDKRCAGIRHELESLKKSGFYNEFLEKYRNAFHLHELSPLEGASKPLRSQEQEQEQEQEQKKEQQQEQKRGGGDVSEKTKLFPQAQQYGEFKNCRLTPDQHANLKAQLNGNLENYIARFDRWIEELKDPTTGILPVKFRKRQAYLTIPNWFERDVREGKTNAAHIGNSSVSGSEAPGSTSERKDSRGNPVYVPRQ